MAFDSIEMGKSQWLDGTFERTPELWRNRPWWTSSINWWLIDIEPAYLYQIRFMVKGQEIHSQSEAFFLSSIRLKHLLLENSSNGTTFLQSYFLFRLGSFSFLQYCKRNSRLAQIKTTAQIQQRASETRIGKTDVDAPANSIRYSPMNCLNKAITNRNVSSFDWFVFKKNKASSTVSDFFKEHTAYRYFIRDYENRTSAH